VIRTEVLNGRETWEENTGGGGFGFRRGGPDGRGRGDAGGGRRGRAALDPEELRERQLQARRAELARLAFVLLLSPADPVTWAGTAESPDGRADVLEVTPAEGPALRLFLDTATHLPLMLTWQGGGPQGATLRLTLDEYKTVGGIRLPHRITRGAGDRTIEEWTISSYRVNPTFKADTFSKP
jgi:hypothetical protein